MKRLLALCVVASLVGFAAAAASTTFQPSTVRVPPAELHPSAKAMRFLLDPPSGAEVGKELRLWATYYHMPTVRPAKAKDGAVPLIGMDGKAISPPLSVRDWCDAAMQGSVWVEGPDGKPTAYMFVDDGGPEQTDCDKHFGELSTGIKTATRRARFVAFHHPRGCDVRPRPLMPYRTIAVDPKKIKMGTVLYVPALRDHGFWLDGELFVHDGYVVAGDRGGAIKGDHIDMFVSESESSPFPDVVSSSPNKTFSAYIVSESDPAAQALKAGNEEVCKDSPRPGRKRPTVNET
jgi:3D (Asp-Asp-Asp) domain-containing protein